MKRVLLALTMALASFSALAAGPVTFCTGGPGGAYEALGSLVGGSIAKKLSVELEVINTGGSIENAELLKDGDCVLAVMQADAVAGRGLPRDISVTDAHKEAIFWIHGKEGVANFTYLTKKENVDRAIAYVVGSGAEVTVKNFATIDTDYAAVKTVEFDDWAEAASAASQGYTMRAGVRIPVAGMLYVGRPGFISPDITEDYADALSIGEIDESSFGKVKDSNDNPLYFTCELSSKGDSGIKVDTWGKPDTYCVRAQVVYNNAYHSKLDPKEARVVKRAVMKGIDSNLKTLR